MINSFLRWLFTLPAKKKWTWKTWLVLIVAGFIVILALIPKARNEISCFFVVSVGQSGGQTGCALYKAPSDRHLNNEIIKELDENLSAYKGQKVVVSSAAGDWEAEQLAVEIEEHLKRSGWEVWLRYYDGNPIKPGISFEFRETGPVVQVGKNI
ncbi:hypothetical protein COU77_00185 [Candidatus Peregrinibacteria bacterium CG10_big_fil_rev_8_21_14_0_10_49_16]|nr:MAG: hypothetical protein COW95_00705 [Candidatus Peregrinibacteria bacterium CG22_combo_CG10-13_8_21_14_all_49_11]PIR52478.1 MAG: hypothetical protein COU77_00185 [Candidatus Peregrinibacteria bacterium CG10_big_fil_rev_8_21_14_0_10_49_16]